MLESLSLSLFESLVLESSLAVLLPGLRMLLREVKMDVTVLPWGSSSALHQRARWPKVLLGLVKLTKLYTWLIFGQDTAQCGSPVLLQPLPQKLESQSLNSVEPVMFNRSLGFTRNFQIHTHCPRWLRTCSLSSSWVGWTCSNDGILVMASGEEWFCHTVRAKWCTPAEWQWRPDLPEPHLLLV